MRTLTASDSADLFRQAPDRFLDVGEGEAAYRRVGTGPDVLFVHGWPVSGATYRNLLPHLVDHVTCHVIDLPGAGSSRFDSDTTLSFEQHITTVQRVVDLLEFDRVAVAGHDSGGMIARYAMVGDQRLAAFGLIGTEQPELSRRIRAFVKARHLPGLSAGLGWVAGQPRIRRLRFVFGDAFADRAWLDGDFDEFCLRPLHDVPERRDAAARVIRSFDEHLTEGLLDVHARIDVPVQLVWGDQDRFFPVDKARAMVATFPNAQLTVIEGASTFCHEEHPSEVADALLPVLTLHR